MDVNLAEYRNPTTRTRRRPRPHDADHGGSLRAAPVSQFFLFKNKPKTPPPSRADRAAEQNPPQQRCDNQPSRRRTVLPEPAAGAADAKAAAAEVETVVENDLYRIVFTNKGAQAKSWVLKKYKDEKGQPLDLVNQDPASFGLPLSLLHLRRSAARPSSIPLFTPAAAGDVAAPGELTYEFSDGTVSVRKTLRFDDSYVVWLETVGHRQRQAGAGVSVMARRFWRPGSQPRRSPPPGSTTSRADSVERLAAKKISGGNTLRGPFQWAGPQDQYFAAIFLPDRHRRRRWSPSAPSYPGSRGPGRASPTTYQG